MNTLQSQTTKRPLGKRLVLGLAGVLAATVVGSAGLAAAAPNQNPTQMPTSKADCANWQSYNFKNYGQCVSTWNKQKKNNNGYGGNNTINTDINVEVNGDNNVINIVIRYIFG